MLFSHIGRTCVHALCMKMHCYFFLNIKHGASQLYWGRPPNTTTCKKPTGGLSLGPLLGPGEGSLSLPAPRKGLQQSSAGTDNRCNFLLTPRMCSSTKFLKGGAGAARVTLPLKFTWRIYPLSERLLHVAIIANQ